MSSDIRVDQVCKNFFKLGGSRFGADNFVKMTLICDAASDGNSVMLEQDEAAFVDSVLSEKIDAAPRYHWRASSGKVDLFKSEAYLREMIWRLNSYNLPNFYEGVSSTSVNEPPFLIEGVTLKKIGEEKSTGIQRLLLGGAFAFNLDRSGNARFSTVCRVAEKDCVDLIADAYYFATGGNTLSVKNALTHLPFSADYESPLQGPKDEIISYCFSGDMRLKTISGEMISFEALYKMYENGEPLPAVASWDADAGEVVYQVPDVVIRHNHDYSAALDIKILGNEGSFRVTPNHNLWVRKAGNEFWVRAQNVREGDEVLLGDGVGKKFVKVVATKPFWGGIKDAFNLNFGEDGAFSNYVVFPPDGENGIVAHNLTWS